MAEEYGTCSGCKDDISLEEIRKGKCDRCGTPFDPFGADENGLRYAGDLHADLPRRAKVK